MRAKEYAQKFLSNTPPKGSDLRVGSWVRWTNDYGVTWEHQVLGFFYDKWTRKHGADVHLDNEAFWFPIKADRLTIIDKPAQP